MHIADLFHGASQKHIAHHRRRRNRYNRTPDCEPNVEFSHEPTSLETAASGASVSHATSACGCCVSEGPPATKPTPPVISAMPTQRSGLTCSCSANFATSA